MTHGELLRKIKNIEKIEPSQSWIFSNKTFIFDYIEAQEQTPPRVLGVNFASLFAARLNLFIREFGSRILLPAASALTVIFMTGNFVLARSQEALPGDAFYSIKIFVEKVEVAMTFNEEKRATLNFELADKRLNEISLLTENAGGKNVSGPDVDVAMENFNNHLSAAVSEMDSVVKSDSSSSKAVAVAKIANNKTSDYVKKIAKAKDIIDSKSDSSSVAKDQIVETIKKIEEVNFNALSVLASLGSEVSQKVEEKINEAAIRTDLVKQKIFAMDKLSAKETDVNLVFDLVDQASSNLDEAKRYLADNDSNKALEKVVASNDMISTAEKMTDAIDFGVATVKEDVKNEPSISPVVKPALSVRPSASPVFTPDLPVVTVTPIPEVSPVASVVPEPSLVPITSPTPILETPIQ